jgi:hypothetical protein
LVFDEMGSAAVYMGVGSRWPQSGIELEAISAIGNQLEWFDVPKLQGSSLKTDWTAIDV